MWQIKKWPKVTLHVLTLSQTSPGFYVSAVQAFRKHFGGKGEIASNEQFLLFPHHFLPVWRTVYHLYKILNCRLQTLSVWKGLKFVVLERVKVRIYKVKYKNKHLTCRVSLNLLTI